MLCIKKKTNRQTNRPNLAFVQFQKGGHRLKRIMCSAFEDGQMAVSLNDLFLTLHFSGNIKQRQCDWEDEEKPHSTSG